VHEDDDEAENAFAGSDGFRSHADHRTEQQSKAKQSKAEQSTKQSKAKQSRRAENRAKQSWAGTKWQFEFWSLSSDLDDVMRYDAKDDTRGRWD